MPLLAGTPAPWFKARTPSRPDYAFASLGGRYVLMVFLPEAGPARDEAMAMLREHRGLFDDVRRVAFGVTRDEAFFNTLADEVPGLRWFFDPAGEIAEMFRLKTESGATEPQWVLIDPSMRVIFSTTMSQTARVFEQVTLFDNPETHAGVILHAPVLIVPRVFESALCRQLIDYYAKAGGQVSGVMREVDGRTIGVVDGFKSRRDADIVDEDLKATLRHRISNRLLPEIEKAFQFKVTRMERYIVARYDAKEGGYFRAHRDNTTAGTVHRKFACSINLNAEEFVGGDLRFPEFGGRTYRPPTGGAVIFSCTLLHEATPVVEGTRYAFLPFFYDDAAAKVRQANSHLITPAAVPEATEA